jgi:hypothetical protein
MSKQPTTTLALRSNGAHNTNASRARARRLARWQATFVRALRQNPNVTAACRAAGVSRFTAYKHREDDEAFAVRWNECLDAAVDEVEEKAFKIAKDGDTQMIQFVLKAHRRSIYGDTARLEVDARLCGVLVVPEKEQKAP